MLGFVLNACEEETVANPAIKFLDLVSIGYAEGNNQSYVTEDIILPNSISGFDQIEVSWISLTPGVIDQNGVVSRNETNTSVTLILRIKYNEFVANKSFVLNVIGTNLEILVTTYVLDDVKTYEINEISSLSVIEKPSISGYRFLHWETLDGIALTDNYQIDSDISIRAVLEEVIMYNYSINVYTQINNSTQYTLIETNSFEGIKDDIITYTHTIEGFELNSSLSDTLSSLSSNNMTFDLYFDHIEYTVSYVVNGSIIETHSYFYEDEVVLLDLVEGIIGWSLTPQGAKLDASFNITQDMTLYGIKENVSVTYTGYYASINQVSDNQLLTMLRTLISTYTYQSYDAARDILQISDEDPNNKANVILVYNRASVRSTWDGGATWNREHVWPQSLLQNSNQKADTHNLKPANPTINSTRGNDPYASGSGTYGRVSGGWYPGDQDKGDIARIVLYMHVRYGLTISAVGNLNIFLRWHEEDPVDTFELNRNEVIFDYQDNRNPFIDHPELAFRVFGAPSFYTAYEDTLYQVFYTLDALYYVEKNKTLLA
jgi:endonuclease I